MATVWTAAGAGARAVAMQGDNMIVAAGNTASPYAFALARYNMDGSLDATFGRTGKVTTIFSANHKDVANAVAVQGDGKIVAAGASTAFELARYNPDGSLVDITPWMEWFLGCLGRAIDGAQTILAAVLAKPRFWKTIAGVALNDRQRLVVHRLLEGFESKLTSSLDARIPWRRTRPQSRQRRSRAASPAVCASTTALL